MMMPVTKTDEKDAYMIAMYGEKMNPPIYKMPSQATIRDPYHRRVYLL